VRADAELVLNPAGRQVPAELCRVAPEVGSLAHLIRQAAITAICDGTERITKASLEAIQFDHLVAPRRRSKPSPHPPTSDNGMMRT
jgi:hypothetical protein